VKNTEAKSGGLKVVKQTMSNFVRTIEAALQYGSPVLLENVMESIDPVLEPVLLKQVVVVGGAATIKLGDATVDYDPKFKLYITTKVRIGIKKKTMPLHNPPPVACHPHRPR
jgi:dynein heavy chain